MPLTEEQRATIAQALTAANVRQDCPSCGHHGWEVVDYYGHIPVSTQPMRLTMEDAIATMPTAVIYCPQCGFIQQHALQALGLI